MFGGFGGVEFLVIILIAVFLWGPDKLPEALRNLRRFIAKARQMASNAASDLSREIGTDIKPEDLNPKTFVRKHILSEEDQEMLTNPLKATMKDLQEGTKPIKDELDQATRGIEETRRNVNGNRTGRNASQAVSGEIAEGESAGESGSGRTAGRYDDAT
ncbi:MAG TPA: twin-arginine translocase TatA/TatE family subunit [Glycomyces sp.]|nr:twin-arginine translocase TatA/TatE family subunit [Glycomyces sp.]